MSVYHRYRELASAILESGLLLIRRLTVVAVAFLALGAASFFALGSAFALVAFVAVFFSAFALGAASFLAAAGFASLASFLASFMLPDFWPVDSVSSNTVKR